DELADVGIVASENRVWRLCSTAGVFASHHRRRRTRRVASKPPCTGAVPPWSSALAQNRDVLGLCWRVGG
ncbi:MAG: hypothetical protein ACRYG2_28395, partial [Janthinobacterium lividum]